MTTRYQESSTTEDAVRLLSNPFNLDHLNPDECEHSEDFLKINNAESNCCLTYERVLSGDVNSASVARYEHHCHQFMSKNKIKSSKEKLILVMCLCFFFMIAEIIGGCIAGSLAVITDGAHLVTDLIGFLISFIAISSSKKKSTSRFNFGFFRVEVLSTLISILLIWVMTGVFIYLATMRLLKDDYEIESDVMILVSCLGVVINIVMFFVLNGGHCFPKHVHSHYTGPKGNSENGQNINVRAAIIHVMGDLIQSIGVCISSVIIKYYPNAKFMDPLCTFLFSIIVICSTLPLLKDSIYILMEAFPNNINYNAILTSLQELNGVRHVHSLCIWSLTVDTNVLIVHLIVDDAVDREKLLSRALRLVNKNCNITYHAIQIEKFNEKCMNKCSSYKTEGLMA